MNDIENLPPPRGMNRERRGALRDVLMEEVRRSSRPWWRRSRRTMAVGAGALTLVLAGGAASAYVAFKAPTDTYSVICFSSASPSALDEYGGNRVAVADPEPADAPPDKVAHTEPLAGKDPIRTCAAMWEDGSITAGAKALNQPRPDGAEARPVPALVACTLEEGVAGVFPGDADTCERLGLPRATR